MQDVYKNIEGYSPKKKENRETLKFFDDMIENMISNKTFA